PSAVFDLDGSLILAVGCALRWKAVIQQIRTFGKCAFRQAVPSCLISSIAWGNRFVTSTPRLRGISTFTRTSIRGSLGPRRCRVQDERSLGKRCSVWAGKESGLPI